MASSLNAGRLRILVVMARPLYPADTGGRIRSSKLLERLARQHHVTVLCFTTDADRHPDHLEKMRACCAALETVDWSDAPKFSPRFYLQLAAALLSRLPFTVWKYRSRAMQARLRELAASGRFDLLICDFLQPSVNCLDVPFRPKVLFQHNVEAVIRQRHARHARNPVTRAYLRLDALKLRRFEHRASHLFDRCIMVSDEDCRTMAREYGARHTSAIPTGVDLDYFRPGHTESEAPEIVFVGSMDWLPNQDAVHYFVDEILPRVRRGTPVVFTIVGRNPPLSIRRLADGRTVQVTGTVDDVRPYVGRARVCVVPLRIGGGTRIKIFEAMAMGKAIVSTSIGAEGLPVTHGENILIADSPEPFAAAVERLLGDAGERQRLGDAGRCLVAQHHGWGTAADRFTEICIDVVNQHRDGRS